MKSLVTTVILGALLAEFGLSGFHTEANDGHAAEQQAAAVMERIVPPGVDDEYFSGRTLPRAEINSDVAEGVRKLNSSVKQLPVYGVKVAQQVEQHGIIALATIDPELLRTGNAIGHEMGQGIRALANAMAKDMIGSARESNIH